MSSTGVAPVAARSWALLRKTGAQSPLPASALVVVQKQSQTETPTKTRLLVIHYSAMPPASLTIGGCLYGAEV